MTTNLLTTGGVDFDNCFEAGSGNQLLYIYTPDGTDIGQKYYNVSEGSAYGTTGMLAPSGTDVGNLLCKKGTRDDGSVIMTVGYSQSEIIGSGVNKRYVKYWGVSSSSGSFNRVPYWGDKDHYLLYFYFYQSVKYSTGKVLSSETIMYIASQKSNGSLPTSVNGTSIPSYDDTNPYDAGISANISETDTFGLSGLNGQKITLRFTPAPTGFL